MATSERNLILILKLKAHFNVPTIHQSVEQFQNQNDQYGGLNKKYLSSVTLRLNNFP